MVTVSCVALRRADFPALMFVLNGVRVRDDSHTNCRNAMKRRVIPLNLYRYKADFQGESANGPHSTLTTRDNVVKRVRHDLWRIRQCTRCHDSAGKKWDSENGVLTSRRGATAVHMGLAEMRQLLFFSRGHCYCLINAITLAAEKTPFLKIAFCNLPSTEKPHFCSTLAEALLPSYTWA